ncbi:unnamed protein product [Moneuplotes crassus]|uniref:Uncharacterized protein n=1 Tax=Euplotes crassus TaxID=5936 RepID=A0AAD1UMA6_EUPCR|nr:unnamed protein product [Moneuplotes crassus]
MIQMIEDQQKIHADGPCQNKDERRIKVRFEKRLEKQSRDINKQAFRSLLEELTGVVPNCYLKLYLEL